MEEAPWDAEKGVAAGVDDRANANAGHQTIRLIKKRIDVQGQKGRNAAG